MDNNLAELNCNILPATIEKWLRETDLDKLQQLWREADRTREKYIGRDIYLRGLIEISNHCVRRCAYCGINWERSNLERYRLNEGEIMEAVARAIDMECGTVVIQAGEDYGLAREFISYIIHRIKDSTSLAVALSLGERPMEDLLAWKQAGADRYFLRFETSDDGLYKVIHPSLKVGESPRQRLQLLCDLREMGYAIGSGIMVGLPGQSYASVAQDIALFRTLDLDMIGVGPYIRSMDTALGTGSLVIKDLGANQVDADELMTYKVIALARIVCPDANITSTTALATINRVAGRRLGLQRGANVFMPNVTPMEYRDSYEIYPRKKSDDTMDDIRSDMELMGRRINGGHGSRKKRSI